MRRAIKHAVEVPHSHSIHRKQEPMREQVPLEVTPLSHTHAPKQLKQSEQLEQPENPLEAKCQQWYAQYQQLVARPVWDTSQEIAACEKALAACCGVPYALLFCTESAAFQALLEALSLSCYDRLYLPANLAPSLYVTASNTPARVYPLAIEPISRRVDGTSLASLLRNRTTRGRDVIVVSHVAGGVFPLYDVEQWICDPNTILIEDATEALGAREQSGLPIGSSYQTSATLLGFSPGSLLDAGGGGAITTRDWQLEKQLRTLSLHQRFGLSLPQIALLHAQLQPLQPSLATPTLLAHLAKARQDVVTRYMTALQEAFMGTSKDCEPQLVESLLDPHAAPSALLLRIDCIHMEMRKERILNIFHKAGIAADFGDERAHAQRASHEELEELGELGKSPLSLSCFTSLRIALQASRTHIELVHLFRAFRDVLTHS